MSSDASWWYLTGGKRKGPVPEAVLLDLIAAGALTPESQVWADGLRGWTAAYDVPALRAIMYQVAAADGGKSPSASPDRPTAQHSGEPGGVATAGPSRLGTRASTSVGEMRLWQDYAIAVHTVAFVAIGTLIKLFETAPEPSFRGVLLWLSAGAGTAAVPAAIGLVGLLYARNRIGGFIAASWAAMILMLVGFLSAL